MDRIGIIFLLIFAMLVLQSMGAFFQVRSYRKAVDRCRKFGTLGIGQKKSRFLIRGNIIIVGSDENGVINGGEMMEGVTILARFHAIDKLLDRPIKGESIYTYLEEFRAMDKKQQKFYQGYIQAMEALEMRFQHQEEKEEPDVVEDGESFNIDDL